MAHDNFKEQFEAALEHLSDPTKTYMRSHKKLMEGYIERMNAVRDCTCALCRESL